jgi:Cd2+/Zn2+-exporting ATPase
MTPPRPADVGSCEVCERHAESTYRIEGMDCHDEVALLERRLTHVRGFEGLTADVVNQRLFVRYDAARVTSADLVAAIGETGMRAWLQHERPHTPLDGASRWRLRLIVASGLALAAGLALEHAHGAPVAVWLALLAALGCGSALTVRRAIQSARALSFDINVLMLIAAGGAIVIDKWSEAATVMFLFALAQWLETRSMERTRRAIRELMNLAPEEAVVRREGTERQVRVADLQVGEIVLVRPGGRIPLDGLILAGTSQINQAPITGEALPVEKGPGDEVFAGTINGTGALEVRVTRVGHDTTLGRIISLVEVAQAQRAPAQTFVERFARYYTPAVIVLAAAVALVPSMLLAQPFIPWMYRALVLLVISCPCALVISTPVSIVSALAGAARNGVLVKGGLYLERAGAVSCVALDKTGTLTSGRPEVSGIVTLNGAGREDVLRLAAALEARSEHPLADAIVRYARAERLSAPAAHGFRALPGLGAEATVGDADVLIGNRRLFAERGFVSPVVGDELARIGATGQTAVLVAASGAAIGVISVADRTRDDAHRTVDRLRRDGVRRVVMLTGDNLNTARALAEDLGVDEFQAELLPAGKVQAIERLRADFGTVAMVGDGVNDAPALAAADVGIAMGAAGNDAVLETADIALMADDLLRIPYVLRLGRATIRNVKANVAFSLVLKGAFLALAVAGIATLWMAVVADMGASLLVVANGLRLLRVE